MDKKTLEEMKIVVDMLTEINSTSIHMTKAMMKDDELLVETQLCLMMCKCGDLYRELGDYFLKQRMDKKTA